MKDTTLGWWKNVTNALSSSHLNYLIVEASQTFGPLFKSIIQKNQTKESLKPTLGLKLSPFHLG